MKRMLAWSSGSPGPPPDGCLSSRSLVPAARARLRFSLVYTEDAVEGYLFGPSALSISLSNMPDISSWENLEECEGAVPHCTDPAAHFCLPFAS